MHASECLFSVLGGLYEGEQEQGVDVRIPVDAKSNTEQSVSYTAAGLYYVKCT